jgi:hypothetical protein
LFIVARIEWHDFEINGFCNGIIIIEVNVVLLKLFFPMFGHVVNVSIIELELGVEVVKLLN